MSRLAEFAVGMGGGYLKEDDRLKEVARRDRLEAEQKTRQEKQDARQAEMDQRTLESSDLQLGEARAGRDLRLSLADAARPREAIAGAGGMIRPETMDNRDVGLPENQTMPNQGLSLGAARVGNQTFASQPEADKFAQTQNRPDAVMGRQSLAYAQAGRPDQASAMDKQRMEYAKWLKQEGIDKVMEAAVRGDTDGMFKNFEVGELRFKAPPTKVERMRDIPGLGKLKTYDYTGTVVSPDGKEEQITKNSHDLAMELYPHQKQLKMLSEMQENVSKQEDRVAKIGIAEARAERARSGGSNGGGESKFTKAVTNAQDNLSRMTKNAADEFRQPSIKEQTNPEAAQAYELERSKFLKTHPDLVSARERLSFMQKKEAEDLGFGKSEQPTLASASKPATGKPSAVLSKLPTGAKQIGTHGGKPVYQAPDGKQFIAN